MTIDEQIAILNAVKEGKKIEAIRRAAESGIVRNWREWKGSPNFFEFDYRIVPEPRRFIVYMWGAAMYAKPYGEDIPSTAQIICTATEDANLGEAAAPYLEALKEKLSRP